MQIAYQTKNHHLHLNQQYFDFNSPFYSLDCDATQKEKQLASENWFQSKRFDFIQKPLFWMDSFGGYLPLSLQFNFTCSVCELCIAFGSLCVMHYTTSEI